MLDQGKVSIGVLGLGYVGLPLAVEFGKKIPTVGLDINRSRVAELKAGKDSSLEVEPEQLQQAKFLRYADDPDDLIDCNVYVVTVPTPIDQHKRPDLSPLVGASRKIESIPCARNAMR